MILDQPARPSMSRLILCFVCACTPGCASLAAVSPLARLERSLVYQPSKYPQGNWQPIGLDFEDAHFTAADGTKLHGWFLSHPQPRAVALFCHGNGGNVAMWADALRQYHDVHGLAVLGFDYRGFGRSEGAPSEAGLIMDARAARKWLAERTGVDEADIVLIGTSLGGGVATQLAAEDGARGLILASTFTSLPDVGAEHTPWLSPRLVMVNRFNSLKAIGRYKGPVLISHGDNDELIPIEQGRRLYEAAPGRKRFVVIPGAGHNGADSSEYRQVLDEFIASL
jgi:fermentation-respiration switch protein FrsA (DUF1100 family)